MIREVAWLYFLHHIYKGKMSAKSWDRDNRMGVNFAESMKTFNCVELKDGVYYSSPECEEIIDKYFKTKTFEESVILQKELEKYDKKGLYGYRISNIPYDMWTRWSKLGDDFDRIKERIRVHYNSQVCNDRILEKLAKSRNIKKWNYKTAHDMFDGNIPETVTVYRGIKCDYDCDYNDGKYTCWTTNRSQGERFAKYYFTGGYQFKPSLSKDPTLLIAEIPFKDIIVFIGGEESEVILENPVDVKKVEKLEQDVNETKSNMKSFDYQAVKYVKGEPVLYVVDYKIVKSDEDKIRCKIKGYKYEDIEVEEGKIKKGWVKVNDFTADNRTHLLDKKDFQEGEARRKIYDIII